MKKLFSKLLLLLIPVIVVSFSIILLPPTRSFKKSMFYSLIDKNKLLTETSSPRIIFIGGSNLSFGLNSERIKDTFNINPINTAIHAGIGLKYMLAITVDQIKENDIIVVVPEYQQFYDDFSDGEIELLSIVADVAPKTIGLLETKQYLKLIRFIPEYTSSKFKDILKSNSQDTIVGIYDRSSFNKYGDVYTHWDLPKENVKPFNSVGKKFDQGALNCLITFRNKVISKNAKIFVAFPSYQDLSFNKSFFQIKEIETKLKENNFVLLGTPERYKINDTLIFNTPYHLTKKGVEYRTTLLIEDLRKAGLITNTLVKLN
jgi:hypothetical protein